MTVTTADHAGFDAPDANGFDVNRSFVLRGIEELHVELDPA